MVTTDKNVEELFEEFITMIRTEKDASAFTVKAYVSDFKLFVKFFKRKKYSLIPNEISTNDIRKYILYLKDTRNYANGSIRRKIQSLKSFFMFLLQNDYIDKNPMYAIKTPEKSKNIPLIPTTEEIERLKTVLGSYQGPNAQRDCMYIKLILYTGMRKSEAIGVNYSDVNLEKNEIRVMGKGKKPRIIPFKEEFGKDLRFYMQGLSFTKDQIKKGKDALFLNEAGNRIDSSKAQKIKDNIFKAAGLDNKGYHIHTLRHTWATSGLNAGMSLDTIQEILGHSSLDTTRIYAKTSKERLKEDVSKLPY